jgi:hypothetical protein
MGRVGIGPSRLYPLDSTSGMNGKGWDGSSRLCSLDSISGVNGKGWDGSSRLCPLNSTSGVNGKGWNGSYQVVSPGQHFRSEWEGLGWFLAGCIP